MVDGRGMPLPSRPDLGSFCRLDELGWQVAGQRLSEIRTEIRDGKR
jgi:hypothetical protein